MAMTEAEWLACEDYSNLLGFLSGIATQRKLRLYAVASCRNVMHLMHSEELHAAIESAELCADGLGSYEQLKAMVDRAKIVRFLLEDSTSDNYDVETHSAACAVVEAASTPFHIGVDSLKRAMAVSGFVWDAGGFRPPHNSSQELIQDIFGNPFRPVALDPAWRTSTALALSQGIYDDRAFDRLPILADALQDACCENEDILNHLRGDGPHVKGCWALDLVLGKE